MKHNYLHIMHLNLFKDCSKPHSCWSESGCVFPNLQHAISSFLVNLFICGQSNKFKIKFIRAFATLSWQSVIVKWPLHIHWAFGISHHDLCHTVRIVTLTYTQKKSGAKKVPQKGLFCGQRRCLWGSFFSECTAKIKDLNVIILLRKCLDASVYSDNSFPVNKHHRVRG